MEIKSIHLRLNVRGGSPMLRFFGRRWLYPILSLFVVLTLVIGSPLIANAVPWGDLIRSGIQFGKAAGMSEKQEIRLGQSINDQITNTRYRLYGNQALDEYVNSVGQRIAANSDKPNIPYTYQVVDDKSMNAFATMGGFVYVHTGLLKAMDNEAQLAGVLGHETGHINARHSVKRMRKVALERGLLSLAGVNRNALVGIGVELAINKPSSRAQETEADELGLKYLGRAGYPQSQMSEFMKKLLKSKSIPTFLADHPGTPERIKAIENKIDPALADRTQGMDTAAYKSKINMLL